jgi:hypothetical protein
MTFSPLRLSRQFAFLFLGLWRSLGLVVAWSLGLAGVHALAAQEPPAAPAPAPDAAGRVVGVVVDRETGQLIRGAHVRVREVGRADFSHSDGVFHLENLRSGDHTLVVQMLGYATVETTVSVQPGETTDIRIELDVSALSLAGIVVTGIGRERGIADTYRPTSVLAGTSWTGASPGRWPKPCGISPGSPRGPSDPPPPSRSSAGWGEIASWSSRTDTGRGTSTARGPITRSGWIRSARSGSRSCVVRRGSSMGAMPWGE